MKNRIFFLIFLTSVTLAMERGGTAQTIVAMHSPKLRLHQQEGLVAPSVEKESSSCCCALGNLMADAPVAVCFISAHYVMAKYIQTLDYLGNQINPNDKLKAE
jgi:hypothetical protein